MAVAWQVQVAVCPCMGDYCMCLGQYGVWAGTVLLHGSVYVIIAGGLLMSASEWLHGCEALKHELRAGL